MPQGFKVVRYPDLNKRVFKTISLNVPEGERINVDYSAVSLEDIIIDALPLQVWGVGVDAFLFVLMPVRVRVRVHTSSPHRIATGRT